MRITSAWFLLSLSVAQWVGGHLCFEVSYFIEIQRQMSASEKALAAIVAQETGIESAVRVLEEAEVVPRGNFYGDFIFSKETEKEKIFYVVEDQSDLVNYKVVANTPKQEDPDSNSNQTTLLKGLFKEFMMPESELPLAPDARHSEPVFHFTAPCSFAFAPVHIHPPAQA